MRHTWNRFAHGAPYGKNLGVFSSLVPCLETNPRLPCSEMCCSSDASLSGGAFAVRYAPLDDITRISHSLPDTSLWTKHRSSHKSNTFAGKLLRNSGMRKGDDRVHCSSSRGMSLCSLLATLTHKRMLGQFMVERAATRSSVCTVVRRFELHSYFVFDHLSATHCESLSCRPVDSEDTSGCS